MIKIGLRSLHSHLIIMMLIIVSGCASTVSKNDRDQSFAMKVVSESRTGISDGMKDGYVDGSSVNNIDSASAGAMSVAYATNHMSMPIGSQGLGAGLMLIDFFSRKESIGYRSNMVMTWIPVREDEDAKDVLGEYLKSVENNAIKSLLEIDEEYEFKIDSVPKKESVGRGLYVSFYRVNGPLCEDWSCYLFAGAVDHEKIDRYLLLDSKITRKPRVQSPEFIVNTENREISVEIATSVIFSKLKTNVKESSSNFSRLPYHITGMDVDGFEYRKLWDTFSGMMDENTFLYTGPKAIGNSDNIPVLRNKGNVHLFIKGQ